MHKLLILKSYLSSLLQTASGQIERLGARRQPLRIADLESLQQFLESRANHVTQTSLYGYLRTRAGTRYPELFANDDFAKAINAAKWNIWLACVSDLAIYTGGLLARKQRQGGADAAGVMRTVVEQILRADVPPEADQAYAGLRDEVRLRVDSCKWSEVADSEAAFSASPDALLRWAPIMDALKQLDAEIVKNSVRFRWQEVRQELRQALDADALLGMQGDSRG